MSSTLAPTRHPHGKRAARAIRLLHEAARHEQLAADVAHLLDAFAELCKARAAEAEADALLAPTSPTGRLLHGAGEAVELDAGPDGHTALAHPAIVNTLEYPNAVSVEASTRRMYAALEAGVLEPAVDAAVSAGATNSLEKMLLHQMATVHMLGMKAAARANDDIRLPGQAPLPPVEQVRLLNVMAKCFDTYQNGPETFAVTGSGTMRRRMNGGVRIVRSGNYFRAPDLHGSGLPHFVVAGAVAPPGAFQPSRETTDN